MMRSIPPHPVRLLCNLAIATSACLSLGACPGDESGLDTSAETETDTDPGPTGTSDTETPIDTEAQPGYSLLLDVTPAAVEIPVEEGYTVALDVTPEVPDSEDAATYVVVLEAFSDAPVVVGPPEQRVPAAPGQHALEIGCDAATDYAVVDLFARIERADNPMEVFATTHETVSVRCVVDSDTDSDTGTPGELPPVVEETIALYAKHDFGELACVVFDALAEAVIGSCSWSGAAGITRDTAANGEQGVVYSSGGKDAYSLNVLDFSRVAGGGEPTSVVPPLGPLDLQPSLVELVGDELFVLGSANTLTSVDLDADGLPVAQGPSTTLPADWSPRDFAIRSDGRFAYLPAGGIIGGGDIHVFERLPSGMWSETAGSPVFLGDYPVRIVITPDGAHLYVAESSRIEGFALDPDTGAATPIAGATVMNVMNDRMAIDPYGDLLAVTHHDEATFSVFTIEADGSLVPVDGSPYATTGRAVGVAFDPNGLFLAVTALATPGDPADDVFMLYRRVPGNAFEELADSPIQTGFTYPALVGSLPL